MLPPSAEIRSQSSPSSGEFKIVLNDNVNMTFCSLLQVQKLLEDVEKLSEFADQFEAA